MRSIFGVALLVGAGAIVPFAPAAGLLALSSVALLLIVRGTPALTGILLVVAPFLYRLGPASRLLLMAVVVLTALRLPGLRIRRSQLTPMLVLGGYCALRLFLGGGVPYLEAFGSVSRLLTALIFGLLGASIWDARKDTNRLGTLVLCVPMVMLAVEVASGGAWSGDAEAARLTAGLSRHSDLGVFAALAFASLLPSARNGRWSAGLAAAAAAAVFASGTRIAMLAVAISFLIYAAAPHFARRRLKIRGKHRAVMLGVLATVVLPLAFPVALQRVQEAVSQGASEYDSRATDSSIGIRNVIWSIQSDYRATLPLGKRLFGSGPGTAEDLVSRRFRGGVSLPHSEYQHMLTDYGYVGLILYVAALVLIALKSFRTFRSTGQGLIGLLVAVTFAVLSATDNPLFHPHAMLLPFVLLAGHGWRADRRPMESRADSQLVGVVS